MISFFASDIAEAAIHGIGMVAAAMDADRSVRGVDSLDEVALHPMIASGLSRADFGVHREVRYPADRRKRKASEGERCDFVLTQDNRPLRHPEAAATLFDSPDAVDLDEAYWLEVKVVAQFTDEGPNRQYASQLLSTVGRDVRKLSKDDGILHAGLLLVLFVERDEVAEHDLGIWQDRCLARSFPIAAPSIRTLPINDRIGNRVCFCALYPVNRL
jgi:hypothetical protein